MEITDLGYLVPKSLVGGWAGASCLSDPHQILQFLIRIASVWTRGVSKRRRAITERGGCRKIRSGWIRGSFNMCCLKIERTHNIYNHLFGVMFDVCLMSLQYCPLTISCLLFQKYPFKSFPHGPLPGGWLAITTQVIAWCLSQTGSSLPSLGATYAISILGWTPNSTAGASLFFQNISSALCDRVGLSKHAHIHRIEFVDIKFYTSCLHSCRAT